MQVHQICHHLVSRYFNNLFIPFSPKKLKQRFTFSFFSPSSPLFCRNMWEKYRKNRGTNAPWRIFFPHSSKISFFSENRWNRTDSMRKIHAHISSFPYRYPFSSRSFFFVKKNTQQKNEKKSYSIKLDICGTHAKKNTVLFKTITL